MLDFRDNVIVRAEFRYQRFLIQSSRSGWGWIMLAIIMLLPALLTALVVWVVALFEVPTDVFNQLGRLSEFAVAALITMNFALHIVIILITIALAANSVSREKVKKTWDVLILTNVDARQLVLGKWWASLHALNGDHVMLSILRIGMVGLLLIFARILDVLPVQTIPHGVAYVIPLTAIVIAFTLIDAAFNVALGLVSAFSNQARAVNTLLSFIVRIAAIGIQIWYFWEIASLILADKPYLGFAILGLGIFLLFVWLILWIAQKIAVYAQVTAP